MSMAAQHKHDRLDRLERAFPELKLKFSFVSLGSGTGVHITHNGTPKDTKRILAFADNLRIINNTEGAIHGYSVSCNDAI